MKKQDAKPQRAESAAAKAERLKAALRANLQKRKAQARARTVDDGSDADETRKD